MAASHESGYAPVNGTRLYYEVVGDGHPLLFIHAGIADLRMWDDQWAHLADRCKLVRYDARGFGRSEQPGVPYSHADDLASLLAYLGIERPHIVGASMGGGIEIDFALEYAGDVAALVLVDAGLGGYDDFSAAARSQWEAIDAALQRGAPEEAVDLELRMWVDGVGRSPDAVHAAVRDKVREMDLPLLLRGGEAVEEKEIDPPAIRRLAEIAAPTLVLVGEHDLPDMHAIANLLAGGIPGARKEVILGAAHLPSMEQPELFNRLLVDFLDGLA